MILLQILVSVLFNDIFFFPFLKGIYDIFINIYKIDEFLYLLWSIDNTKKKNTMKRIPDLYLVSSNVYLSTIQKQQMRFWRINLNKIVFVFCVALGGD